MNKVSFFLVGFTLILACIAVSRTSEDQSCFTSAPVQCFYFDGPEVPANEGAELFYGLEKEAEDRTGELLAGAPPSNYNLIQYCDTAEILSWNDKFAEWLKERQMILGNIGYAEVLPFVTAERTQYKWVLSHQLTYNSCATFGFTNSYEASVLYNIALCSGQYQNRYNPMFIYRNTSGGRGGRTLSEVLQYNFGHGQAAAERVGNYPSLSGSDPDAGERSCNAVRVTAEQAMECLKAGVGIYIGNSTAVRASKQNSDGLRTAVIGGSWSHSTAFIGYIAINGKDYFLWRNSHGSQYTAADKLLTPQDCCWFDREAFNKMLSTCKGYGGPFAILPKSVVSSTVKAAPESSIGPEFAVVPQACTSGGCTAVSGNRYKRRW